MDMTSSGDVWWPRPTMEVLTSARDIMMRQHLTGQASFMKKLHTRVLTVSSIGLACIEASIHSSIGTTLLAVSGLKSVTCLVLQGTFVAVWAFIGWLSGQALVKSPLQWVSFGVLQATLGFHDPRHWLAQWQLWGRILHTMGAFANSAAAFGSRLSNNVEAIAGWEKVVMHFKRAAHLSLFAISCFRISALLPAKVVHRYGRIVEPWPLVLTPSERVVRYVRKHKVLAAVSAVAAMVLVGHLLMNGREERNQQVVVGANQAGAIAWNVTKVAGGSAYFVLDNTVGFAWRWIFDSPNERTRNYAAETIVKLGDRLPAMTASVNKLTDALTNVLAEFVNHTQLRRSLSKNPGP